MYHVRFAEPLSTLYRRVVGQSSVSVQDILIDTARKKLRHRVYASTNVSYTKTDDEPDTLLSGVKVTQQMI